MNRTKEIETKEITMSALLISQQINLLIEMCTFTPVYNSASSSVNQ